MSKRLQVLMSEADLDRLRKVAKRERVSVGEWVRRAIAGVLDQESNKPLEDKLKALQIATQYRFPAPDIDQMNREIEAGYGNLP